MKWCFNQMPDYGGSNNSAFQKVLQISSVENEYLVGRETLQNSLDAAWFQNSNLLGNVYYDLDFSKYNNGNISEDDLKNTRFKIRYSFTEFYGKEKKKILELTKLNMLYERAKRSFLFGNNKKHKVIADEYDLNFIDNDDPLRLLCVEDFGAHGLFGDPFDKDFDRKHESPFFNLLLWTGISDKKGTGGGGTFGIGKNALQIASHSKLTFGYSCFPSSHSSDITRRFIACAYWNDHKFESQGYSGQGIFAEKSDTYELLSNELADEFAESLKMSKRDHQRLSDTGTSIAVVNPTLTKEDLIQSLVKYWWPAITQKTIEIEVVDNGNKEIIDHSYLGEYSHYIYSLNLALGINHDYDNKFKSGTHSQPLYAKNSEKLDLGDYAITSKSLLEDIPYGNDLAGIALIRKPKMVVTYYKPESEGLGVYIARDKIDGALRATENPSHSDWIGKANNSKMISQKSKERANKNHQHAKVIKQFIDKQLSSIQNITDERQIKPKVIPQFIKRLSRFNSFGKGSSGPPKDYEPISVSFINKSTLPKDDNIITSTTIRFTLKDDYKYDYKGYPEFNLYLADSEGKPVKEVEPPRFIINDDTQQKEVITLKPCEDIDFELETFPYNSNYSIIIEAKFIRSE